MSSGEARRAAEIPEVPELRPVMYLGNSEAPASLYDSTDSLDDNHDDQVPTRGWASSHSSPGLRHDDQKPAAGVMHSHNSTGLG